MFGANIYHLLFHLKLKQHRAIDVIAMKANKLLNSPKRIYSISRSFVRNNNIDVF